MPNKVLTSYVEVNKSKFYSYFFAPSSLEEIEQYIKELRKEHKKAKHVCYAYRLNEKSKSTDDGEPKGTAGRPLLELLYKKNITIGALIVVRYFGGTELGASRLLRTYVSAGVSALNKLEDK